MNMTVEFLIGCACAVALAVVAFGLRVVWLGLFGRPEEPHVLRPDHRLNQTHSIGEEVSGD